MVRYIDRLRIVQWDTLRTFQTVHYRITLKIKFHFLKTISCKMPFKIILDFVILLPKLFWPTVRKKCSSDRGKLLKFEAEGQEFAKFLRSLEQFIQTVKGQNNFW